MLETIASVQSVMASVSGDGRLDLSACISGKYKRTGNRVILATKRSATIAWDQSSSTQPTLQLIFHAHLHAQ